MKKEIELFQDALGNTVSIPVLHHRSSRKGPHIVLTCLVHGDEVVGVHAALQLFDEVKRSKRFCGSLTVLSCLNFGGFEQSSRMFRSEFLNGSSGSQNLNRCFGAQRGYLTDQVADRILAELKALKPDFVIDCHSYASNSLVHVIVDRPGGGIEKKLLSLCEKSAIPYYLEYKSEIQKAQKLDFSLSNQLCLAKIPAVTVELGPLSGFSRGEGELAVQALRNLLSACGSLDEGVVDLFDAQYAEIPPDGLFFREPIVNDSKFSGFYRPQLDVGMPVRKGDVVAEIVDLRGRIVHRVKAPSSGYTLVFENVAYVYPRAQFGVMICSEKGKK